jgi:hypothetical protein
MNQEELLIDKSAVFSYTYTKLDNKLNIGI